MKCERLRSSIGAYLDGELDSKIRGAVRRHLERCPDCSLRYEELKTLRDELRSLNDFEGEVGEDFTNELLARGREEMGLDGSPEEGRESNGSNRLAPANALVTATLLVGLLVGTVLGVQFTNVVQSSRSVETPRQLSENPEPDRPIVANPDTFADAYFELATAETAGGVP